MSLKPSNSASPATALRGQWLGVAIALTALFFALGGSAFADSAVSSAKRLITGKSIKDSSITGKDIKNGSITSKDLKKGTLPDAIAGVPGPAGAPGPAGPAGPQGASGATNVVVRKTISAAIVNGSGADLDVACNAGEKAISGGSIWVNASTSNVLDGAPARSFPTASSGQFVPEGGVPVGWHVEAVNQTGVSAELHGYAICAAP